MDDVHRQQLFEEFVAEGNCLHEAEFEIPCLGRTAPYYFGTPRPMSGRQLTIIGSVGSDLLIEATNLNQINLIGVANAGLPVASAVCEELARRGIDAKLFVLDKEGHMDFAPVSAEHGQLNVIVDNAVITGNTLRRVHSNMADLGIKVGYALTIFDHELLGNMSDRNAMQENDSSLLCMFGFRNLIDMARSRQSARMDVYLAYAQAFGTSSLCGFADQLSGSHGENP